MPKKDLFASSSSSSSDDDEDDALAQEMAAAAMRERRRDPHAYTPFAGQKKTTSARTEQQRASSEAASTDSSGSGDGRTGEEGGGRRQRSQADAAAASKTKTPKGRGPDNRTADDDDGGIRINQQYAAKYEEVKRRKELQQLTEKYGHQIRINDGEEEDEEDEEDDDAVLLTEDKELAFAKAFLAIRQSAVKQARKQQPNGDNRKKQGDEGVCTHPDENRVATDGTDDLLEANTVFFPSMEEQIRENTEVFTRSLAKKRQQRKKFTLADEYRRGVATGVEAHVKDGEMNDADAGCRHSQGNRRIQPQSAKERQLRESFLKSVAESTEVFDVQPVAPLETQRGEPENTTSSEARRLLQGAFAIRDTDASGPAEEDPDEAFLREFFVGELWKPENNKKRRQKVSEGAEHETSHGDSDDEEEEEGNNYAALAELAQAEADERFYAEAEAWERAYQDRAYRHQEEEADHVQTFPRAIGEHAAGILRKSVKSSRKDARLRRLERMRELREQQVAELRRLKTLKRQEIESQRALIASVAGIAGHQGGALGGKEEKKRKKFGKDEDHDDDATMARLRALWSEKDLEEEFDPQKFDKKMAQIFDDAYYDENNVDEEEMAFFEDEEDEAGARHNDDDDDDDDTSNGRAGGGLRGDAEAEVEEEPEWYKAQSLEEAVAMTARKTQNKGRDKHDGGNEVDDALALLYPSAVMHAAETASFEGRREHIEHMIRHQKKGGETSHEADDKKGETLRRLREELETKEKEYWQLHHDSTLDGGAIKTRFKYRQVAPEDFTLTVEEILSRDDRQLNMLVPMSCYAAYLQEDANRRDRMKVERRRQRGFREVDPTRRSRRYGDVSKTALVDANMTEEEGERWSKKVRGGLRRLRESLAGDSDEDPAGRDGAGHGKGAKTSQKSQLHERRQQEGAHEPKKPRHEREGNGQRRQDPQPHHAHERGNVRRGRAGRGD